MIPRFASFANLPGNSSISGLAHFLLNVLMREAECFTSLLDMEVWVMEVLLTIVLGLAINSDSAVINGGFEQKDPLTGMPSGWSFTSLPGKQNLVCYGTESIGANDKENRALVISVAEGHPAERIAYNAHQSLKRLVAGKTYRVSANVRTKGLTTLPMIVVQCLDKTGTKYLGFARSAERKLSGDLIEWERVTTDITIPDGTTVARLRIGIPAEGNAGGKAVIDEVVVDELK